MSGQYWGLHRWKPAIGDGIFEGASRGLPEAARTSITEISGLGVSRAANVALSPYGVLFFWDAMALCACGWWVFIPSTFRDGYCFLLPAVVSDRRTSFASSAFASFAPFTSFASVCWDMPYIGVIDIVYVACGVSATRIELSFPLLLQHHIFDHFL